MAQRFGRKPYDEAPEVGLKDRLQHDRGRHLRDPIPYRRDAERPLTAIGLRNVSPQDRLRPIRACAQYDVELVEHALHAILLDARERLAIDARRAAIRLHPPPRLPQDVTPVDPIEQGMEAALRRSLGCDPEAALQLAHFVELGGRHRGDWDRTSRSCPRACVLDRQDHRRDPSLRPRCSSRTSPLLRSPRTPAAHDSLSPSAYTSRAALTRAAQTGLSCSAHLLARVLRPLPRRDLPRDLRTETQQTWPSPRNDRLGSRVVNLSRLQASHDVAARVLASSAEAFDTPLGPPGSLPLPGVCYSALRRLPRRDLHPLEMNSVKQTILCPLRHDAPSAVSLAIQKKWIVGIVANVGGVGALGATILTRPLYTPAGRRRRSALR